MKTAILTGFGIFGPYKHNPVQDLAREYDGKTLGNIEVTGLVLPCTYHGAFNVLCKKVDQLLPDIILSTGFASRIKKIRLEKVGKNMMNGKYPDANGLKPENELIIRNGKTLYSTNADNDRLVNLLCGYEIPAKVSFDAEDFICNSLIYLTARMIEEEKLPIKHAFFHTPWTEDYSDEVEEGKVTIKKKDLQDAVEILLQDMSIQSDML